MATELLVKLVLSGHDVFLLDDEGEETTGAGIPNGSGRGRGNGYSFGGGVSSGTGAGDGYGDGQSVGHGWGDGDGDVPPHFDFDLREEYGYQLPS